MKTPPLVILIATSLIAACAQTESSNLVNLAIDTYTPPPNALRIAETRAKQYWAKHQNELGKSTRYLAIESDTILSADIPNLYSKLTKSPGVNSSDIEEYQANNDIDIFCINIFDTTTQRLAAGGVCRRGRTGARQPNPDRKISGGVHRL
jgi:hypothetical protein